MINANGVSYTFSKMEKQNGSVKIAEKVRKMEPRLAINNDQGPGPPFFVDWITSLSVGTRFLCMDTKTRNILELEILARSPKGFICLIDHGDNSTVWHAPKMFCHQKDFLDLLES